MTDSSLEAVVRDRLEEIHTTAPGSIGDLMDFRLLSCDTEAGEYTMQCRTLPWMRNIPGTLHGGLCATILDQAMGFIAYCVKPGEGIAPTVQLQVSYHRSLIPGEEVLVKVKVKSVTRSLMHLSGEVFAVKTPEKLCLSGNSVFFFKPAE